MSRPARRRRHYAAQAMSLEQLERWIERLEPPPLIDSVSMLDGYLTAIIVGPCSIDPYQWMGHMLGPHSAIGADGSEQFAAMQAIAARFNAIGEGLATAPRNYAPIFERTDNGIVDAGPWCRGFMAAMMLRPEAWRPLRDLRHIEHGLLLPILLHCTDGAGCPLLGPTRPGPAGEEFLRTAYHDIPIVVLAIREFWMPQHVRKADTQA
jgi:uncharacterized protein